MPLIDIAHHQDQGLGAARAPPDRLRRNEPQHYVFDSNQRLNASSIASFLSSLNAGTFARKVSTNTTRRPPVQSLDAAGQRDGCRHPAVMERPSFLSDVHALRGPRARIYAHRVVGLPVDVSALRYVRTASWPPAPKTSNARTVDAAAHHGPGSPPPPQRRR